MPRNREQPELTPAIRATLDRVNAAGHEARRHKLEEEKAARERQDGILWLLEAVDGEGRRYFSTYTLAAALDVSQTFVQQQARKARIRQER